MGFATRNKPLLAAGFVAIMCALLSLQASGSAQPVDMAGVGVHRAEDSYEPNDTIDQAKRITVCTPQHHAFDELADVDWMKFRAWSDVRYTIETSELSGINDTKLWLYDADGNLLAQNDDDPNNPPASRIEWIASDDGTYYIKVAHPKNQGGSGFTYTVHLSAADPGVDSFEPDNTMEEATQIDVDGGRDVHTFHSACGGDVDWVMFEAIAGTTYTIRTSNLIGGNDTVLRLVDASGDQIAFDDDSSDTYPASRIDWVAEQGGTYYIEVTPFNPFLGGDDIGYYVEVATSSAAPTPPIPPGACADDFERDDAPGTAKPIEVNGAPRDYTFHEPGNEDWVKFWAHAGNEYTIETSELEGGNDTVICLYDAALRVQACDDDIAPPGNLASRIVWLAPESGTYYVKARHDNPYVTDCLDYALQVTSRIPCADAYEDDDVPQQAQTIEPGEQQYHNFHVACVDNRAHEPDGADWVTFVAAEGVTYTITTSELGGSNDTMLELYDEGVLYNPAHQPLVTSDDDLGDLPASQIVWQAPDTDDYYVKVSPFDTRVGGCGVDYTLEVMPSVDTLELVASPKVVRAGGVETSLLRACVQDIRQEPLSGVTVHFTSTWGSLTRVTGTTDPSGCVTADLTSVEPGTALVTASVSPRTDTELVTFRSYVYIPLVFKSWPPQPYTPSVPSPADGATNVDPVGLELGWAGGDPSPGDSVRYDVYLGTSGSPPLHETTDPFPAGQTTITYDPGDLRGGTTYYWSVVARDAGGLESEGPQWSFKTRTCTCQDPREPEDDDYYGAATLSGIDFVGDTAQIESYVCQAHLSADAEEWDFYWFLAPRVGTVEVMLDVPDTVNYDLFLWDWEAGDRGAFKSSEDPENGAEETIVHDVKLTAPGYGYYWLVVKSNGDYDPCNSYVLSVTYQ